jgi:hypothetical protein
VLSTQWVLSSDGKEEHGSSPWEDTGLTIADLYSEKTRYAFDVEVLPGASCLNASNSRLKVQTHPYPSDLYGAGTWFSVLPVGFGLALLVRPYITWRFREIEGTRIFPDMVLHNVLPIRKRPPLPVIHGMPHFGLLCGAILWILIFAFMIWRAPVPRMGLRVTWEAHDTIERQKSPWPDTLQVYVAETGGRPRFLINGEEVDRRALRTKLLDQLSKRAEWSVYFEAAPDILYMDDIYAIDTIQACGARFCWITPKMREEWQHKPQGRN